MEHIKIYVKWRQFEEFPDYYVSNTGLVKLNNRIIPARMSKNGREYFILGNETPYKFGRFYLYTLVWDVWGDRKRIKYTHEIHHKDKNVFNNNINNLELLTKQEHRDKHKTKPRKNKDEK
jgi:HNH endonuclease